MSSGKTNIKRVKDETLFDHPKGLFYLAFTEGWERFSFYGMTARPAEFWVILLGRPLNRALQQRETEMLNRAIQPTVDRRTFLRNVARSSKLVAGLGLASGG